MTSGTPQLRLGCVPFHSTQHAVRRYVQRRGAALLNQQCWLWGCDVRRQAGNGLLLRGFSRLRPTCDRNRSTQYTLAEHGLTVRLWGSGMYVGSQAEGVFLNRFLFEPRYATHEPDVWQDPAKLKTCPRFWDHALLSRFCLWISDYETWASSEFGIASRRTSLSCFRESACPAEEIAAEWQELATLLRPTQP